MDHSIARPGSGSPGQPSRARARAARLGRRLAAVDPVQASLWAALPLLFLLLHPYPGVVRDGRIYVGRGLADHDPGGVGLDLMFARDQQTGFTLLRPLVRAVLGVLPAPEASLVLSLAGGALWLAAAVALGRALASGRTAWAAAACLLALPAGYGHGAFVFGEVLATPRIFAEAAVMAALAGLVRGQLVACSALLGLALLLHPLMAAAGIGVAALAWGSDRPGRGAAVVLAGAVVGTALIAVAFRRGEMDAEWLSVVRLSPYLFPSLWPEQAWGQVVRDLTGATLGGLLLAGRARGVLWAAALVAVLGLGVSAVFGDAWPLTLVLQAQPWRATWLLAVAGHAGLAIAAVALWSRGPAGRLTLAVLLTAWLASDHLTTAAPLSALALALHLADRRGALAALSPRLAGAACLVPALVALAHTGAAAVLALDLLRAGRAAGRATPADLLLTLDLHTAPVLAGILCLAMIPLTLRSRPARAAAAAAVAAGIAGAALLWDAREPDQRALGPGPQVAELRRLLQGTPGEVFWAGGDIEPWFWAGRPAFASLLQKGPALFSRPLALEWKSRVDALLAAGLLRPADLRGWDRDAHQPEDVVLSAGAVTAFCGDARRPAAIVTPGDQRAAAPEGYPARLWTSPAPSGRLTLVDGRFRWRVDTAFTVILCRPPA